MATVKNEFLATSPIHWPATIPATIFSYPSPSSSASSHFQQQPQQQAKEEYSGMWNLEQPPSTPSLNSLSPLTEFFMQQDEDIISMSSLDNSSFQSGLTTEDDEEHFFTGTGFTASSSSANSSLQNQNHHSQQQQIYGASSPTSPPTPSSFHNSGQHEGTNVLLNSVVRSRIDEITSELFDDVDEIIAPPPVMMNSQHNQIIQQQQQQQQQQMPPPPPPAGLVPLPPPQDSFGTIRSFNFQQPIQPTFASWVTPTVPRGSPLGSWHQPVLQPPAPIWNSAYSGGIPQQQQQTQDPQVALVQLLVMCAHAVAANNVSTADVILTRLRQLTSQDGTPMERLASYFAEALAARITRATGSALFKGLSSDKLLESDGTTQASMLEAFSTFYDYLPIGKFDHLTMNQVILDAVERERAIHILDLQLWFGTQWPAFLQALATRPGGPPRVRITAVGTSEHDLRATGQKLRDCARTLRVHLQYKELLLPNLAEQFHAGLVELHPGEAFIVNSLSQFHYLLGTDSTSEPTSDTKFANFMAHIRALRPKVLVMAENDANHNSHDFLKRFGECLKYYSAVFDAMATCSSSPTGRLKMERLFAAPKIRNIIACDDAERVERHESMVDWTRRFESAGFRPLPLSQRAVNQAKLLLRLYYTNGYTLHSERGSLVIGWRSLPLNTVSAWRAT